MADSTPNESITEVVPEVLGEYLKGELTALREFYPEFPQANRNFKMPSVSIITSSNDFRPIDPYPCVPVVPAQIENNKANYRWAVGIYDIAIQLDLWARNKEERDDLFDAMFNVLNPDIKPMGLRLVMEKYFNQIVQFDYIGHTLGTTEEQSQTDEWRVTMRLLATCKAVRLRREFIITDLPTPSEIEAAGEINEKVVVGGEE